MKYSRLIRLAVSLAIFVLALEGLARLDDFVTYGAPFFGKYSEESMYTLDAIGKRGKPHARFRKWEFNSLGYRSPELDPAKIRIVSIGGSETFGLYESKGEEYPRQLERELNQNAGRDEFQVINVANPGESIWTAIQRVPEIARTIQPAAAVIYPTPAFYIYPPSRENGLSVPASRSSSFEWRLSERIWEFTKQVLPDPLQNKLREWQIARALRGKIAVDKLPEENVERYRSDVRAIALMLRGYGIEPILVTHASEFGPVLTKRDLYLLTTWRRFYPKLKEQGFLDMEDRMNRAVRSVGQEERIPVVEAERLIPREPRFFGDYTHFSDEGAHLMAIYIARQLEPMLPRRQTASLPAPVVTKHAVLTPAQSVDLPR